MVVCLTDIKCLTYFFRIWDVDSAVCLRVLEGHNELVRCIRFDDTRIVSGAYDGLASTEFLYSTSLAHLYDVRIYYCTFNWLCLNFSEGSKFGILKLLLTLELVAKFFVLELYG